MKDFSKLVEIVSVNYNTPDLIENLHNSVRSFIGNNYQFTIIDGSSKDNFIAINHLQSNPNTRIFHFDHNIHHGPGMDYAISNSKYDYLLILDSDVTIIKEGMLDEMFKLIKDNTYCVAQIIFVNRSNGRTNQSEGEIAYAHPRCMLIKKSEYMKHKKFILHGAPCIEAMIDINDSRTISSLVNFPNIRSFADIQNRGTVKRFGYGIRQPFIPVFNINKSVSKDTINIIVRTSGRPNYFKNCYSSIKNQSHKNINLIVSVDDEPSFKYVKQYNPNYIIRVERKPKSSRSFFDNEVGRTRLSAPYNLYINKMYEYLVNGYVLFLDDDDIFASNDSLAIISNNIKSENQLIFWRVGFPPNRLIPTDAVWGGRPICCNFSGIGFAFHSKYKNNALWDEWTLCDYKVGNRLYNTINSKVYINQMLTKIQRVRANGLGKRDDL